VKLPKSISETPILEKEPFYLKDQLTLFLIDKNEKKK